MKTNISPANQNTPNSQIFSTGYEWQKRSNSHNVITEYNIFMTPRCSNPNILDSKQQQSINFNIPLKHPPLSPNTSANSQQQHFEYLLLQKPSKKQLKLPIKEMLKSYSGMHFNEKNKNDKIMHLYDLQKNDNPQIITSLSHRGPENHSLELFKSSPRKTTPLTQEEEASGSKITGKGSFDMNIPSSTSNKIRKMLMTSPYNNSKALVNSLKTLKNLSHGNLLNDDLKSQTNSNIYVNSLSKPSKGFLSNFNFSRKNLVKLAAANNMGNKGFNEGKNKINNNDRNIVKTIESKGGVIQEESTFKNSLSYKSTTHNTSKSADKLKDKQTEDLFNLFNRAKCLLQKYKIKEKEWNQEKKELLKEIENLKANQRTND